MDGVGWRDTLIMLLVVSVPIAAVHWFLRRPYDPGAVPRDAMTSRGKGRAIGAGLFVWPARAYRRTLIDEADDASHRVPDGGEGRGFDSNELADSPEHHAEVVRRLKNGR